MIIPDINRIVTASYVPEKRRRFGWVKDVNGNPVAKRVLLIDHTTGLYLGSTTSRASDGYWEIKGLPLGQAEHSILEVAIDDTRAYDSPARCHKSLVV